VANQLPKRMRFKDGVYYFISFAGGWKPLGRDLSRALENYLRLYGDSCPIDARDTVTELYLSTVMG